MGVPLHCTRCGEDAWIVAEMEPLCRSCYHHDDAPGPTRDPALRKAAIEVLEARAALVSYDQGQSLIRWNKALDALREELSR